MVNYVAKDKYFLSTLWGKNPLIWALQESIHL